MRILFTTRVISRNQELRALAGSYKTIIWSKGPPFSIFGWQFCMFDFCRAGVRWCKLLSFEKPKMRISVFRISLQSENIYFFQIVFGIAYVIVKV